MTNHTPGPWKITKTTHKGEFVNVLTAGEAMEHLFYMEVAPGQKKAEANARLIAAAPELLETLEYLESVLSEQSEETFAMELLRIRAAIAYATGK